MPDSKRRGSLILLVPALLAGAVLLPAEAARAENGSTWTIAADRDSLGDHQGRLAVTMPKSSPLQNGKAVTAALIINCASAFTSGPNHPQLNVLFTFLKHMHMTNRVETRYRFDEGPIRDYRLAISGRNGAYLVALPKFKDEDPIIDIVAARRLRVEVYLPRATNTFLDFNVRGAAEALRAIACH